MKTLRKSIQELRMGMITYLGYHFFGVLSIDRASEIGASIGKFVGPKLRAHQTACYNLKRSFPDYTEAEIHSIVMGMWDNLGRIVAEFPHMPKLSGESLWKRVTIKGQENLVHAKQSGKGIILYSGHIGNWEIGPKASYEFGFPLMLVYRPANNKYVETLYRKSRANSHAGLYPKGKESARNILRTLKEGGYVGMLVDQKMNDGIPIPFFGRDAMTASAMADIALKMGCPLVGARVIRTKGAHFVVEILPPLSIEGKDNKAIMTEVNVLFEKWIRENPSQWLWLHRRWPREEGQPR